MPMIVTSELSIELTMLNRSPLRVNIASVQVIEMKTTAIGSIIQRMLRNRITITNASKATDHKNRMRPSFSTISNMS